MTVAELIQRLQTCNQSAVATTVDVSIGVSAPIIEVEDNDEEVTLIFDYNAGAGA